MDFYAQPKNEVILSVFLDETELAELKTHLRSQPALEKVSERVIAMDHALDPHAVVETIRHSQLAIKVANESMELGKDGMQAAIGALVAGWVARRNERQKEKIEANKAEPLLFDQHGHRLDIRPESKRRKK